MFIIVSFVIPKSQEQGPRCGVVCEYTVLAGLPGFARDSRSIIIHVLVAVIPRFNK